MVWLHLKNIYESRELKEEATAEKISVVRQEGNRDVNRSFQFYSLDAIIAVGYRVNSIRATQFRQWATAVLRQFAIRGYVVDKKRMENGTFLSEDYFEGMMVRSASSGLLLLEEVAYAFFQNLGTEEPEDAEIEDGGEEDANDEQDEEVLNPTGGKPRDEHRGGSNQEEGEHVLQRRKEGVTDFPIEETMPDARPQNDDEDVGENHQRDGRIEELKG